MVDWDKATLVRVEKEWITDVHTMFESQRLKFWEKETSTNLMYLNFNSETNLLKLMYISTSGLERGMRVLPGDRKMLHTKKSVVWNSSIILLKFYS